VRKKTPTKPKELPLGSLDAKQTKLPFPAGERKGFETAENPENRQMLVAKNSVTENLLGKMKTPLNRPSSHRERKNEE
jgi:hypothetical protein